MKIIFTFRTGTQLKLSPEELTELQEPDFFEKHNVSFDLSGVTGEIKEDDE